MWLLPNHHQNTKGEATGPGEGQEADGCVKFPFLFPHPLIAREADEQGCQQGEGGEESASEEKKDGRGPHGEDGGDEITVFSNFFHYKIPRLEV